jgi:peptidyl-prolyl cis-trans isomerase C
MTQVSSASWTRLSTVATMVLLMTACHKQQESAVPPAGDKPAPVAVATVNGTPISKTEYDFYVKTLTQGKPMELSPDQKSQVLDELVSMQLMANQGAKDHLENEPDVAARLEVTRMRLLADAESQKYLKDKEPSDADLHAEYDTAVGSLDRTEYHARHILVPTKEQAEGLIKKIKGGAKFEDVAKANSIDGSKTNGGDLGWFTAARMVKPFSDAVKGLKKGEMTQEPVQTQFGWHIIQLEDTRDVTPPPFDQVKDQLKNRVLQKKLQVYIEDLKKTATIDKKLDVIGAVAPKPAAAPADAPAAAPSAANP